MCHNKNQRSHTPRLKPSTDKQINIKKNHTHRKPKLRQIEQKGRQRDGGGEDFLRKTGKGTGKDEETDKDGERKTKTDS